jgi:hypothetical protein
MSLPSRIFRRIFLICVLVCGLSARAAEAGESQSQSITVGGHAAPVCSLSALQATQASNITLDGGAINRAALNVPSLHDAKTAQLRPASISLVFEMICNGAHSIHIATAKGGLHTASELPERGGFANHVHYRAHVHWGATSTTLRTSGVAGESTPKAESHGAFRGTVFLNLIIDGAGAGHLPLLSGTYNDALTVTLSPRL